MVNVSGRLALPSGSQIVGQVVRAMARWVGYRLASSLGLMAVIVVLVLVAVLSGLGHRRGRRRVVSSWDRRIGSGRPASRYRGRRR